MNMRQLNTRSFWRREKIFIVRCFYLHDAWHSSRLQCDDGSILILAKVNKGRISEADFANGKGKRMQCFGRSHFSPPCLENHCLFWKILDNLASMDQDWVRNLGTRMIKNLRMQETVLNYCFTYFYTVEWTKLRSWYEKSDSLSSTWVTCLNGLSVSYCLFAEAFGFSNIISLK